MALVLAMVMVVAMGVTVFADTTTYKITVTPSGSGVSIGGKTFSAYKLFDVTYADTDEDDENQNDAFAYSINVNNYFYKNAKTVLDKYFTFTDTANADVKTVSVKKDTTFDESAAYALTEELNGINKLFKNATADGSAQGDADDKAEITVPSAGYYLITGSGKPISQPQEDVMAAIALTTTQPEATIKAKVDAPSIDKQVDTPIDTDKHENEKSIGDTVEFTIPTKVPDMAGYTKKYFFVITDTLSKGLTYQNDAVIVVNIDGSEVELEEDTHYTLTTSDKGNDGTEIKIVFNDFLNNFKDFAGADITITYTAILNDNAVLGKGGNTNKVKLTYSNNPNKESSGESDEPTEGDATGTTPDSITKTYVTGIELLKIDGATKAKLKDVVFNITGTKLNDIQETTYDRFVKLAADEEYTDTTYYLLKDGTYTDKAAITDGDGKNDDKYASTTDQYKKVTETAFSKTEGEAVTYQATTDENGKITLSGLGSGTYTLTEIKTNDGYNLLKDPIEITITADTKTESDKTVFDTWSFVKKVGSTTDAKVTTVNSDNRFELTVENNKGTELPSTGGIGTIIFYIVGGIIVLAAIVLLVVRRRLNTNK